MTFKDLKKRVTLQAAQQHVKLFERLRNKPFWIWNVEQHKREDIKTIGDCCFNHIIGLFAKDTIEKPILDYEKLIIYAYQVNSFGNNKSGNSVGCYNRNARRERT